MAPRRLHLVLAYRAAPVAPPRGLTRRSRVTATTSSPLPVAGPRLLGGGDSGKQNEKQRRNEEKEYNNGTPDESHVVLGDAR